MPGFIPAEHEGVVVNHDEHRHGRASYREESKPLYVPFPGHGYGHRAAPSHPPRPSTTTTTTMHRGPPSFPFPPPLSLPRPPTTTAYGLNEPQWIPGAPAPLIYELSPYARVPLPPLVTVHPILAFDVFHEQNPALTWTIDQPPKYAAPTPGRSNVHIHMPVHMNQNQNVNVNLDMSPYHWKSLPATDPPTSTPLRIRIECFSESLITVHPLHAHPHNGGISTGIITVGDVLSAIYTGARRCATEQLCLAFNIDPRISGASAITNYGQLVRRDARAGARGPAMGEDGVSSNVRASMAFRTRWAGLAPSRREQDVWLLHTRSIAS
ncbi:hypothetical protein CVT25_000287 [Psilocybe cyanescens]|uniref:DUF6699 domain-containing protein n=1 Tax=Psilocybe cyanescens TaxID=93625 RepID=A0A409XS56_PSICY|nr:hypothetical protein CVT25_000287 [Psilocybe cyanescens]